MSDVSTTMRLYLDAARWRRDWARSTRVTKSSADAMRRHVGGVNDVVRGVRNNLALLGVGFSAAQTVLNSARLDKSLTGVKQTAGATTEQASDLRKELFRMSSETGQQIESLRGGFDDLIQSGESWGSAMAVIPEINKAMAVTNAQANVLTGGLSVAGQAFDFDLSKPGLALDLLDKMVVAGREGNAELEDLSGIFGRVGVNANAANLQFSETLGFVEQLSLIERKPERLATLADSTLRIFNNANYKRQVEKATGVRFFNDDESARNALDVLDDIGKKYRTLTTDQGRSSFISKAFGKTDLDTQRGLRSLLSGVDDDNNKLKDLRDMVGRIEQASGVIDRDLQSAIGNAIDQGGRLKTVLGEAADRFVQPINRVLVGATKKLIDSKEDDGFNLSGGELVAGAGATALALLAGKKYGGKLISKLSGGALGTAGGVAVGKSLEAAAGVAPVYVVNMPAGLGGGVGGGLLDAVGRGGKSNLLRGGAGRVVSGIGFGALKGQSLTNIAAMGGMTALKATGLVGLAGAGGYGLGTLINKTLIEGTGFSDSIGRAIAKTLAFFGNDTAREAVNREKANNKLLIEIESKDPAYQARVKQLHADKMDKLDLEVATGMAMGSL